MSDLDEILQGGSPRVVGTNEVALLGSDQWVVIYDNFNFPMLKHRKNEIFALA